MPPGRGVKQVYYIILIPRPTLTFGKKTKNTDRQISSPYKAILLPYVAIIITIVYVLVTFLYYLNYFNNYLFLSIYVLCSYLQGGDYGLFFTILSPFGRSGGHFDVIMGLFFELLQIYIF